MLAPEEAPVTVNNFIEYVESGFYNGLVFHRVINDFMIQGGGFTPDMSQRATRAPDQKRVAAESASGKQSVALLPWPEPRLLTVQPPSFFINLKDNEFLNGKPYKAGYAVFGHVVKGMDVVDSIAGVKTGYRGPHGDVPVDSVIINKAYVVKEGKKPAKAEPKAS